LTTFLNVEILVRERFADEVSNPVYFWLRDISPVK
jgi:hypothetical protein